LRMAGNPQERRLSIKKIWVLLGRSQLNKNNNRVWIVKSPQQ
jgi:hypothetical protein